MQQEPTTREMKLTNKQYFAAFSQLLLARTTVLTNDLDGPRLLPMSEPLAQPMARGS